MKHTQRNGAKWDRLYLMVNTSATEQTITKHGKAFFERFDGDQKLQRSEKMKTIRRWRKNDKWYIT